MPRERKRPVGLGGADGSAQAERGRIVRLPDGTFVRTKGSTWTSFKGSGSRDGLSRKFDTVELDRPYEQDDRVFAVISLIQDAFADVPLCVYDGDPLMAEADEQVEKISSDHPLSILFETWNPVFDSALAHTAIAQGLSLRGEAPIVLTKEGGERLEVYGDGPNAMIETPGEMWVVPGDIVQEKIDRETGMISRWDVRTQQGSKRYDPATVLNPRLLHPRSPYRGFGPMQAAFGAAAQNYLAERYRNALLKRGGEPGGMVVVGEILDPDEARRIRAELKQEWDDPDSAGGTKLLEGGASYQAAQLSPKEMAYMESLAHNADRISAAFRVSKELLGQGDSNFGARLRQEMEAFWRMRIIPWLRLVERSFNSRLFPRLVDREAQNYRCRFDLSKVEALAGDVAAKVELATKLQKSGVPLNTALQIAGVRGANDLAGGDTPLVQGAWMRLEDAAMVSDPVEVVEPTSPQDSPDRPVADESDRTPPTANVRDSEATANPKVTLDGRQISSLMEIVTAVQGGRLPMETAVKVIVAAFPFDTERASTLLSDLAEPSQGVSSPVTAESVMAEESEDDETDEKAEAIRLAMLTRAEFEDERDEVYKRWNPLANMTATELETWSKNPCSRRASVRPSAVIARNLELLETPKADWTRKHVRNANRAISFIERMRGMEQGDPAVQGCPSKRDISLRNWAHNPGGSITSGKAQTSPACRLDGESQDECISRKVPEVMAENPGMDQDQAVAIAASLCAESCSDQSEGGKSCSGHPSVVREARGEDVRTDPLEDFEAARKFERDMERRRAPYERSFRAKVRRVFDRMRRAQLRALEEFAKSGTKPNHPHLKTTDQTRRIAPATVDAILRRVDEDAAADSAWGDDWGGPAVQSFLKRRKLSAAEAQDAVARALMQRANVSETDIEALVVAAEERWAEEMQALLAPIYEKAVENSLETAARQIGMAMVPMTNPKVTRLLATKPIEVAEGINSTIANQTRIKLLRALQDHANITDLQSAVLEIEGLLTEEVRTVYKHARQRALAIARTESRQAMMQAQKIQHDAGVEAGEVTGTRWIAGGGLPESMGGGRRDNHWVLDRTTVPPGGEFQLGPNLTAPHPHAPGLPAGEVVNCGCTFASVVPTFTQRPSEVSNDEA